MLASLQRLALVALLAGACGVPPPASVQVEFGAPRTLTRAQLDEMPAATVAYKDRSYEGVRLRDVLAGLGAAADAPVTAVAADGYRKQLSVETLQRDDAILAHTVDGAPLGEGEGPLRLVIPNSPGMSVKQLVRLARP
jgi:DMSO/TMAO reductase YedYZ molybdopterin-dependent catalytic subunit